MINFFSLFLILLPFEQSKISPSFFDKLISDYEKEGITLNIPETINQFSKQLIQNNILLESDLHSPDQLYNKLDEARSIIDPYELSITSVLPKTPLNNFIEEIDLLKVSDAELCKLALITYYQSYSEKYAEIELQLNENRTVTFNNYDLPIANFEKRLMIEIVDRQNQNVTLNNAKLIVKADPYTPNEFVDFIVRKGAKMGIRKIEYKRSSDN